MCARDGREIPVLELLVAHRSPKGEVDYVSIVAHDISDRKRAEEMLRASETRFRALIENSVDGILLCDAAGIHLYASPSMSRILGFSTDELLGQNTLDFFHPDDRDQGASLFGELVQTPGALAWPLPVRPQGWILALGGRPGKEPAPRSRGPRRGH